MKPMIEVIRDIMIWKQNGEEPDGMKPFTAGDTYARHTAQAISLWN